MAAPVPDERASPGVLLVTRDAEAAPFSAEDLAVLELLGRRVSARLDSARLIRDLHLSSSTDSLTGLLNHGVFLSRLAEHVQRARETGEELSLLVLDMDGFKQINDTAGHWEGNRVLRALADALRAACREEDVVARCGGDEFAVLLPGVGPEGAAAVAERTAEALHDAAARPGIRIPVSASWGIASYPWDATTDEALFQRADDRLYEAKKAGGNHLACDPIVIGAEGTGSHVRPVVQLHPPEASLSPRG
jgi:diguanylate cyclase (GGDEF)-like protein